MMRSYLLAGFLAALSCPTYGLVFTDKIKQTVGGESLSLLHGVDDPTSVTFCTPSDSASASWKFNTEGFPDDEAVISPLNNDGSTLQCQDGSKCTLDLDGLKFPLRITRVDEKEPIFTFQDPTTSLYVSRASDLTLELTPDVSDARLFTLEKITSDSAEN